MHSFVSFLLAAAAVNALPTEVLSSTASFDILRVGDSLRLRNNGLFKRDNGNESLAFTVLARENGDLADAIFPRIGDKIVLDLPGFSPVARDLFPRAAPIDCDEEDCVKCGNVKVLVGDPITSGADGQVYKATLQDGTEVAVKSGQDTQLQKHGAQVMQALQGNSHVVKYYADCDSGLNWWTVMEVLNSGTLDARIDAQVFTYNQVTTKAYMDQILDAVSFMHGKGYSHGDIKGNNVLIGDGEIVKIIDFDYASSDKTIPKVDGQEAFQSPEGRTGGSIDAKANDVWALGVLLVKMITGKQPWPNANAANAVAIWKDNLDSKRAEACGKEWPKFSDDFCKLLADVFVEQDQRTSAATFKTRLAVTNLLKDDSCGSGKTKREIDLEEYIVLAIYDEE